MKRLKNSLVAWSFVGSITSFGALYAVVPYDHFLDISLAVALGVCFAATVRYARDAWVSFRSGQSGAEFLLVAMFSIVAVLLGQRAWNIALRVLDRPDWLVDSPVTILIPWLLSWAVSLALIAPDIDFEREEAKTGIWKSVALFIGGTVAGLAIALSFGSKSGAELSQYVMWPQLINRAHCSKAETVWVSSNGVYHTEDSPWRSQVIPRYCFKTVPEAEIRGFRPAKVRKASKP